MELHHRFQKLFMFLKVRGIVWTVLAATTVFMMSCADPTVVYKLSNKRFVVTEDTFEFSEYGENCEKIGAEVAEVATNSEFQEISQGVCDDAITEHQEIYINTRVSYSHFWRRDYWNSEQVLNQYWWSGEPNNKGAQPDGATSHRCNGWRGSCRPTAMSCHYTNQESVSEALLFDTCCLRVNPGLCVQDIDECASPSGHICPVNATCVNTQYSYSCQCSPGYVIDEAGDSCLDIDECTTSQHNCPEGRCVNTEGGFTCRCQSGYEYDNNTCVDIDECKSSVCPANSTCTNRESTFTCTCGSGYIMDNDVCVDEDECRLVTCSSDSTCVNSPGSFRCQCNSGFVKQGSACVATPTSAAPAIPSVAAATSAGSTLTPSAPTVTPSVPTVTPSATVATSAGRTVTPSAPAATSAAPTVTPSAPTVTPSATAATSAGRTVTPSSPAVTSFIGELCGYIRCGVNSECDDIRVACVCKTGFAPDGNGFGCTDIEECNDPNLYECPDNSFCVNTEGNYTCECHAGYTKLASACEDIDECENSTLYNCQEFRSCFNLNGSYSCECDEGYIEQGGICEDIDECENSALYTCPSQSWCVNLNGTYKCECEPGYFKNEVGLCEEIPTESFKLRTCPCVCPALVKEVVKDLPDAKQSSDKIQKKLEVKSTQLATAVRKKISASDERGSSASFGIIALTLLGLEFFLITIGDIITVVYFVQQKLGQWICGGGGT